MSIDFDIWRKPWRARRRAAEHTNEYVSSESSAQRSIKANVKGYSTFFPAIYSTAIPAELSVDIAIIYTTGDGTTSSLPRRITFSQPTLELQKWLKNITNASIQIVECTVSLTTLNDNNCPNDEHYNQLFSMIFDALKPLIGPKIDKLQIVGVNFYRLAQGLFAKGWDFLSSSTSLQNIHLVNCKVNLEQLVAFLSGQQAETAKHFVVLNANHQTVHKQPLAPNITLSVNTTTETIADTAHFVYS
jgi:hypothetical protein